MNGANIAKMLNALSFNLSLPSCTAPNMNGISSGHASSLSMAPAAISHTKSHVFRAIFGSPSSLSAVNSSFFNVTFVPSANLTYSAPSSDVKSRRANTALTSLARPSLDVRSVRSNCVAS